MTQPPAPPYGAPPPPQRRRPSAWWFVVGGALVVAAVVAAVVLFVWTLSGFLHSDATVSAGQSETVRLEGDDRRMLWTDDDQQQTCEIVDAATGGPVETRPVTGSLTRSQDGDTWTGEATFDPGSGTVEITCTGGGTVIVGPAPAVDSFVLGLLATIFVPLLLGGAGVVVLIVTGVLFATGRPRPHR